MVHLPPQVTELLRRPDSVKVLTTINCDGTPHSVVCGVLHVPDDETIGVGRVWFKTTADNLARDPRAEFLVWQGKYAFSVQVVLSRTSDDAAEVELINEALDKMDMKADSVWIFTPQSVTDEGITPTTGQKIV